MRHDASVPVGSRRQEFAASDPVPGSGTIGSKKRRPDRLETLRSASGSRRLDPLGRWRMCTEVSGSLIRCSASLPHYFECIAKIRCSQPRFEQRHVREGIDFLLGIARVATAPVVSCARRPQRGRSCRAALARSLDEADAIRGPCPKCLGARPNGHSTQVNRRKDLEIMIDALAGTLYGVWPKKAV
jgi:hypothetical protein